MAMVFEYFLNAEQAQRLNDRVKQNDITHFDAAEDKKAISVRVGITEDQRADLIARQDLILGNCLKIKVGLMALRGTPMADPSTWSYTNSLFSANDRNARRNEKLKTIEVRYWDLQRDREKILVTESDPVRRDKLVQGIDTQLATLEAEKAERIRDTSGQSR
jgi:hypothetical protein